MSEREDKKPRFDPYTGELLEENTEDRREENGNIAGNEEPTYEKFVWEPLREVENQQDYTNRNDMVEHLPVMHADNREKSSGTATACLILGILSLLSAVSCCFTIFSIPLAIASIICGALAEKPNNPRDKKRFIGLLMSIISIVVTVLMVIFLIIAMNTVDFYDLEDSIYNEFYDDDYHDHDMDIDDFFDGGQEINEYPSDYGQIQEL